MCEPFIVMWILLHKSYFVELAYLTMWLSKSASCLQGLMQESCMSRTSIVKSAISLSC